MKKLLFSIALFLAVTITVQADQLQTFIDKITQYDCVENELIVGDKLIRDKSSTDTFERHLKSINIITVEADCVNEHELEIAPILYFLQRGDGADKYETLIYASDNSYSILIVGQREANNQINTLYTLFVDRDDRDYMLIVMKGSFDDDAIQSFMESL